MKTNTPTESSQLWHSAVPGIELFEANLVRHRFGKHFHDGYTIGLNENGQGRCLYRGQTYEHHPGTFNCINPGEVHTGEVASPQGWRFRNLYVSVSAMRRVLHQLDYADQSLPCFASIIVDNTALRVLFYQLFQALNNPVSQLEPQSLLLRFFFLMFKRDDHFSNSSAAEFSLKQESEAVCTVRHYLKTHCRQDISIEAIAHLVNLNPFYLIRCFQRQVGVSPHCYKQHWQLLGAKQALSTQQSLSAIAIAHGFYDQSHFTRVFKNTFGVTPGRYRKVNFVQYKSH